MKLDFIPLDKLSVSKTNMRYAKKAPDVSDILPTIRKRGVIQPHESVVLFNTGGALKYLQVLHTPR